MPVHFFLNIGQNGYILLDLPYGTGYTKGIERTLSYGKRMRRAAEFPEVAQATYAHRPA
jgi:hypothetical protein